MRCRKRKTRLCLKIIFFIGLIWLIMYLFRLIYVVERKNHLCPSFKHQTNERVKYIFNLDRWRGLMLNDRSYFMENRTSWCDIPSELRKISNAICRMYNGNDCSRLPCQMIYSSVKTLEDIQCTNDGRILKKADEKSPESQSDLLCKRGFSLDLFLKKSEDFSYPSIIGDVITPFSKEFYIDVLDKEFRSCNSIWGFIFNFESIINYPWTTQQKYLKLFDITFGYDRSLYDFIPAPWLFNYLEQLKFNSNRLSLQKVMDGKKAIHSRTTSDISWINTPTLSSTRNKEHNSSSVTAPILWMNSNCHTSSKRTEYMMELMKFIDVDNYGTCGNNILNLPEHIRNIQNSTNRHLKDRGSYNWEAGKLALSSEYLFTIAIENSITYDYITEKLWHALVAGSIPIYLGAPNVEDWLPCETNCIIDLRQFSTPKDAALYIKTVAMNKTLYQSYHQWRNKPVKKQFENMIHYFQNISDYSLDCMLCLMAHRVEQGEDINQIKTKFKTTIGHF